MSLYKQFSMNKSAETEGVWIEYGETEEGKQIAFKVSRMSKSNRRYTKAMESATRPYRRSLELGTLSDSIAESVYREVFVTSVLTDWRNVQDEEGNELTFTKENALKLMTDLPELYQSLQDSATRAALFRDERVEGEAKN